jgi:hypothetical protein
MVHIIILIRSDHFYLIKIGRILSIFLEEHLVLDLWQNTIRDVESFHLDETKRTNWFNFGHAYPETPLKKSILFFI